MGVQEKESRQRTRKTNLQRLVLHTIAAAGVLSVALLAPNALRALAQVGILPHKRQKESIMSARKRLIEKGLVSYRQGVLHLTPAGEAALRRYELYAYKISRPKHWDGKWRVLVFDIPERKRKVRERMREVLMSIGFVRLQDSVWLYPYDCEDLVTLLKADFSIGKDILYLIVDALEYDAPYRKLFGLPTP